ncbi:hypothetical protein CHARACLAT_018000 [Characodon lateralis]|uniref:Uncharacterized protein n=1 Tax=Characodon lateralis TaxID=208331 RepID=A0ABU7D1I4_9TELE|nr:hypothetical protein [Characodon lateralis]
MSLPLRASRGGGKGSRPSPSTCEDTRANPEADRHRVTLKRSVLRPSSMLLLLSVFTAAADDNTANTKLCLDSFVWSPLWLTQQETVCFVCYVLFCRVVCVYKWSKHESCPICQWPSVF